MAQIPQLVGKGDIRKNSIAPNTIITSPLTEADSPPRTDAPPFQLPNDSTPASEYTGSVDPIAAVPPKCSGMNQPRISRSQNEDIERDDGDMDNRMQQSTSSIAH